VEVIIACTRDERAIEFQCVTRVARAVFLRFPVRYLAHFLEYLHLELSFHNTSFPIMAGVPKV